MAEFTMADYEKWRWKKDVLHLNGGRIFFGWGHQCIDQPRLMAIDKYFKKDRSTQRSYMVDGKHTFDRLEDALAVLGGPPVLSAEEQALLDAMPEGWFVPERGSRHRYSALHSMGFVEWGRDEKDNVTVRRRADG